MSVERSGVSEVRDLYYDTIEILGVASDVTNVFLQQTRPGDWHYNFTYNRADQVTHCYCYNCCCSSYLCYCYNCCYCYNVRERNVLFNDVLNTFYLRLYGVRHMVKDHSDSEKGNPLLPHRLILSINSKGSFICTIPQTG